MNGSPSEPELPPPPPEVPGYRLLEPLGSGGMGSVYRAEQLRLQRIVAIKFLHPLPPAGDSPGATLPNRSASRESLALAQISHPHVVALHDSGVVNGREYLVLEYLAGGSLRDRLKGVPWSPLDVIPVVRSIAEALTVIHERGLLHLDLKPENVLFDDKGTLKLTDFGLSRTQVAAATLSDLGLVHGSLDYSALELRSGLQVDPRADLFSLAVMAYEMLTGRLPGRVFQSAREANPALTVAADVTLARGLARYPDNRPNSVAEFAAELMLALTPPPGRTRRFWLLLAALLGGTAGLAGWLWFWRTTPAIVAPLHPAIPNHGQRMPLVRLQRGATATWITDPNDAELWLGPEGVAGLQRQGVLAARGQLVEEDQPPRGKSLIPLWPAPRPVLLLDQHAHQVFFHPLIQPDLAAALLGQWPAWPRQEKTFAQLPNRVHAGTFPADSLGEGREWEISATHAYRWMRGDGVHLERFRGRSALCLCKRNSAQPSLPVGCGQHLRQMAPKPGTLVVVRSRIQLDEGYGRVAIVPQHVLSIPEEDETPTARRLRKLAQPSKQIGRPGEPPTLLYRLTDWIAPEPEPRWYWTVWEWPPYTAEDGFSLDIDYTGLGRVWITEIQLFLWERGVPGG